MYDMTKSSEFYKILTSTWLHQIVSSCVVSFPATWLVINLQVTVSRLSKDYQMTVSYIYLASGKETTQLEVEVKFL